ncbi:IS3 family transposase [Kibdelosporangium aridum]|uniref:IS3 family transposase n=1 Tax=Kibdelosporangium aridum TaxID=2030 RepID=UPI000B2CE460|nr:IS3 family transposase [Kibdelosporangium aridum]
MSLATLIAAQRVEHGIPHAVSCRALGVSQAWFYKWRRGDSSLRRRRRAALAAVIAYLFRQHHGTYGSPRITADLRTMGWRVSENTVARVMAEQGLVARRKRKRRSTTRPDRSARKAPDALRRDFRPPARPDARWVGDLTEIPAVRVISCGPLSALWTGIPGRESRLWLGGVNVGHRRLRRGRWRAG